MRVSCNLFPEHIKQEVGGSGVDLNIKAYYDNMWDKMSTSTEHGTKTVKI